MPESHAAHTAGRRLTRNQRIVLEALGTAHRPQGAYDLLEAVREDGFRAPLQVYRALDGLMAAGLVHRIESLNAYLTCDHAPHRHPACFVICEMCRDTVELGVGDIAGRLRERASESGFSVASISVEMTGVCARCGGGNAPA